MGECVPVSLFPIRTDPDEEPTEAKLVDFDSGEADEVFDALGSKTARTLLVELHDEPRPASALAESVDTSLQNVQYHLQRLEAADLVTVVDTWYSESGTEMAVYAPADRALVLFAGEDRKGSLRQLLTRLAGAISVLAMGAIVVAITLGRSERGPPLNGGNASAPILDTGGDPFVTGLAFLLGGLVVLSALLVIERVLR